MDLIPALLIAAVLLSLIVWMIGGSMSERRPRRHSDVDRVVHAIDGVACGLEKIAEAIAMQQPRDPFGHFSMHVTGIELKEEQMSPAAVDHTPQLDLAATDVRAKVSVTGPKNSSFATSGAYLTNAEVTWSKSDESESGALELEAAPDSIEYEVDGTTPILDVNGNQIPVYSVYANTPLEPAEGTRVSGKVTVSGPGMANCDKVVSYGNAAVGHFTMSGVEAAEA